MVGLLDTELDHQVYSVPLDCWTLNWISRCILKRVGIAPNNLRYHVLIYCVTFLTKTILARPCLKKTMGQIM